jgi:hypothetical protein
MLNGWSDERIVNWLENSPEGAVVRREIMHDDATPELWVNEHRAKLDYYLPNKKLQRLLGKGRRRAVRPAQADPPGRASPSSDPMSSSWTSARAPAVS